MTTRDPLFWKRFSTAVHFDEEQRNELKHSDSWLGRQQAKRNRRNCICWIFWLCFFLFVAGIVIVIIWLLRNGYFDKSIKGANPNVDTQVVGRR